MERSLPPMPALVHTGFRVVEHGFRFANAYPDARTEAPAPYGWSLSIEGRAGGMVHAALDYWLAEGLERPADTETPPDGDVLADYLALRQRDAFAGVAAELVMAARVEGVVAQLQHACLPPHGDALVELVRALEAGRPCPLGLVPRAAAPPRSDAEGRGHQVLAVGLRMGDELELLAYDPTHPGLEVVLRREGAGWVCEAEGAEPRRFGAWFLDRGYVVRIPDIREAHGTTVDLSHHDLRQWEPPPKQDLQDYRLVGVDLRGHAGLSSLDLQGVDAREARLDEAVLRGCDLRGCDLRQASLRGCDLSGSTLDRARLREADLGRARLHGAALRRVLASGLRARAVELHEVDLSEAVLEGASLRAASIVDGELSGARLERARLEGATIRGSRLVRAEASGVRMEGATITQARFDGADLRGASLRGASLRGTSFVGADLRGADLGEATLVDVDLRFADLRGAELGRARLEHVILTAAACEDVRFEGAAARRMILTPDVLALLRGQGGTVAVEQLVVRTARQQVGGPARSLHGGRFGVFAVRAGTRDLWRWDGLPHAWTRVGEPGAGVAVTDDGLFRLTAGQDAVQRWSGGEGWETIGGPARRLWAGGLGLFVEIPGSGELFRWDGAPDRWTAVSGPAAGFGVGDADLFRRSLGQGVVQRWLEGGEWETIGDPASALWAGGSGLFAARPPEGGIWRWEGDPGRWSRVCDASASLAVGDDELYRLSPQRDAVERVLGSASLAVGGPADEIVVAGRELLALAPRTGDVWRLV